MNSEQLARQPIGDNQISGVIAGCADKKVIGSVKIQFVTPQFFAQTLGLPRALTRVAWFCGHGGDPRAEGTKMVHRKGQIYLSPDVRRSIEYLDNIARAQFNVSATNQIS
jgi:hypothetical protein